MFSILDEEDSVMECGQVARVNVVGVVGVGVVAPAGSVSSSSPSPSTPRAMDIQPISYLQTKEPGNRRNKAKDKKKSQKSFMKRNIPRMVDPYQWKGHEEEMALFFLY